ncbi:hypothetical protein A0J61_11519 [Choanephora cucurbitarum]|uniref:Uncharacterized protein n=1 Tax=Choanephora cucurbitarum TaxID=101091 RepID=A0A1C7MUC9_9FUNG|nr:hypothetical protein A0J61_11519 [Choanephora cucurbitarum]
MANKKPQDDGSQSPINYLALQLMPLNSLYSKMEDAEKWTAFHTYKLPHMGTALQTELKAAIHL